MKTRSFSKNVKIDTHEYVYQGFLIPPYNISKNFKNIEGTLFWCAKIKRRTFSKNVKIDPQEYVYQGSPYNAYINSKNIDNELGYPLYYLQKLKKKIERTLFWWRI